MHLVRIPSAAVLVAAFLSLGGCAWFGGSTSTDPAGGEDPVAGTEPAPSPPPRAEAAPDSTLEEAPPQLRVRISEEERGELLERTMDDLDAARSTAVRQPDTTALPAEERQRWETLDHYIELTESFLAEDDLRAAADVALKARLLAAELNRD